MNEMTRFINRKGTFLTAILLCPNGRFSLVGNVPVELIEVDIRLALELSVRFGIYAYDAYFLQCALQLRCPLLTLDRSMQRVARQLNISLLEKP